MRAIMLMSHDEAQTVQKNNNMPIFYYISVKNGQR